MIRSAELTSLNDFRLNRKQSSSSTEVIVYPSNIKDDYEDNGKKIKGQDRIQFTIYEMDKEFSDVGDSATIGDNAVTAPPPSSPESPDPAVASGANSENTDTNTSQTGTESEVDLSRFSGETPFAKLTDRLKIKTKEAKVNGIKTVVLPIQDKIADQNSVEWEGSTLQELKRVTANLAYNLMGSKETGIDVSADAIKRILGDSSLGTAGRLYLVEDILSVQNLMSRATGKTLNPNLELLFKGPTLRPFTFNFKLSPRDESEGVNVKKIIRFFKQAMAPRLETGTLFLKAPYIFKIKYLMGSGNTEMHPGLNLIKECGLTNCTVDYTPNNSYMTYTDGTMVSYTINLTFQEIVPIYDLDYLDKEVEGHSIGY